jgi:hypothetical protein
MSFHDILLVKRNIGTGIPRPSDGRGAEVIMGKMGNEAEILYPDRPGRGGGRNSVMAGVKLKVYE